MMAKMGNQSLQKKTFPKLKDSVFPGERVHCPHIVERGATGTARRLAYPAKAK